jgi:hypothetical protein
VPIRTSTFFATTVSSLPQAFSLSSLPADPVIVTRDRNNVNAVLPGDLAITARVTRRSPQPRSNAARGDRP